MGNKTEKYIECLISHFVFNDEKRMRKYDKEFMRLVIK